MTADEFDRWFAYHVAAFPGLAAWLRKAPHVTTEGMPGRRDILASWHRLLAATSLEAARLATDEMQAMDEHDLPRAFDRHPPMVARLAQRHRPAPKPRWVDGEQAVRCLLCRDSGLVNCYHTATVKDTAMGRLFAKVKAGTCDYVNGPRTMEVPCRCEAGAAWEAKTRRAMHVQRVDRYDPALHCRVEADPMSEADVANLRRFAAEAGEKSFAHYTEEHAWKG